MDYKKTLIAFYLLLFSCRPTLCADNITVAKEIFPQVQSKLKNKSSDFLEHEVKRLGNKRISLNAYVSFEADWKLLTTLTQQFSKYPSWILPRINEFAPGEKFYIQIISISPDVKFPNHLEVQLALILPGLNIPITRVFKFEPSLATDNSILSFKITALKSEESQVKDLSGYIHFYKDPNNPFRAWGYVDITVLLNYWLVYEALPEKILNKEAGERVRIIMENYQGFENTNR